MTLAAVATSMGIEPTSAQVSADGDLDFRGTLGVAKDAPVGFSRITLTFTIDTPTPDKLPKLLELTDRYCVVAQTLAEIRPDQDDPRRPQGLNTSHERRTEGAPRSRPRDPGVFRSSFFTSSRS